MSWDTYAMAKVISILLMLASPIRKVAKVVAYNLERHKLLQQTSHVRSRFGRVVVSFCMASCRPAISRISGLSAWQ